MNKIRFNTSYKELWYKYIPESDTWQIADNEYGLKNLRIFDAKTKRIDECFSHVFNELNKISMNTLVLKDIIDWHLDSAELWLKENHIDYKVVNSKIDCNDNKVNIIVKNNMVIDIK